MIFFWFFHIIKRTKTVKGERKKFTIRLLKKLWVYGFNNILVLSGCSVNFRYEHDIKINFLYLLYNILLPWWPVDCWFIFTERKWRYQIFIIWKSYKIGKWWVYILPENLNIANHNLTPLLNIFIGWRVSIYSATAPLLPSRRLLEPSAIFETLRLRFSPWKFLWHTKCILYCTFCAVGNFWKVIRKNNN